MSFFAPFKHTPWWVPFAAALFSAGTLAASVPAKDDRPQDFAVRVPIVTTKATPYQRLTLPIGAYLAVRQTDLRDVRVFNAQGESVPIALIDAPPQTHLSERQETAQGFPLRAEAATPARDWNVEVHRGADGAVVSVNQSDKTHPANAPVRGYLIDTGVHAEARVALDLRLGDGASGLQHVAVEASDDLVQWQLVQPDAVLAVLALNGEQIRREHIELGETHARYLRLLWQSPAEAAPLQQVRYTLRQSHTEAPSLVWTEPLTPSRNAAGELILNLPARLPVERLHIQLPADNTLAPVTLAVREGAMRPWRVATQTTIYRLVSDGHDWTSPDILLDGEPIDSLRLQTHRPEGLGKALPSLRVGLTPRQLIFLAQGAGPYTLALGNANATPTALAADTLIPGFGTSTAPPIGDASVAAIAAPPRPQASAPGDAPVDTHKGVLWGILVGGVLVMAAMAYSLLKQTSPPA